VAGLVALPVLAGTACRRSPPSMRYDDFVTLGGSFGSAAPPDPSLEVHRLGPGGSFVMTLTGAPAYCGTGSVHYAEAGLVSRSCESTEHVDPAAVDAWASRIRAECHVDLEKAAVSWTFRPKGIHTIQVGVDDGPRMATYVQVNRSECIEDCPPWADRIWKCIGDLARGGSRP
jgi:hypothetical protein